MSALHTFLFKGAPVRGMLVRLTDSWQESLRRREGGAIHPPEVRALLGEMAAAAVLLQANIKFDGALILQIHGDGPVKLAVAEAQSDLSFRTTAKVSGAVPPGAGIEALLNRHGQGRCAITLASADPRPGQQPYQGIVPLHGDRREPLQRLADVLEHYMLQSEQLDTMLALAADDSVAAGLLIQRLPGQARLGGARHEDRIGADDDFDRISRLARTVSAHELLTLETEPLLSRLFWQEQVRLFRPRTPRFACTCSRERVRGMLRSLGRDESDSLIAERGVVEVGCEFCGQKYRFDAVDVAEMFTAARDQPPGSRSLQ